MDNFDILSDVFLELFTGAYRTFCMVRDDWGWLGASLIGLYILRRAIKILRKVY